MKTTWAIGLAIFILIGTRVQAVVPHKIQSVKSKAMVIPDRREFPLSTEVNPCDDFHKYVCDKVETNFALPENRSIHSFAFGDSRERLLEAKKQFMENILTEKGLNERSLQIKNYYKACMNVKTRAVDEKKRVSELIKKMNSLKTSAQFAQMAIQDMQDGSGGMLGVYENNNPDDPQILDLGVGASLLTLPEVKYYENKELLAEYQKIMAQFFIATKIEVDPAKADLRAAHLLELEKTAAKTFPEAAVRRQRYSEKRPMTQDEFLKKYPQFKLEEIFKKIPKQAILSVPIPEGIDSVHAALAGADLQVVKDFYLFSELSDIMDEAYPEFFKHGFEFNKKYFGGPSERPDLQERCTQRTMGSFAKEVDQLMIERLFPNFNDQKVRDLAAQIRGSIIAGLEKNTWLSSEAKLEALNKIKKAKLFLVRPQNEKEWDFSPIRKYSEQHALANARIRRQAEFEKEIDNLNHPANLVKWGMGPLTVNAYYSPEENKFVMPMGILQYPFYDEKQSLSENLAAIGSVMGHELGHSIDDQGSRYDSDGKLKPWMSMKDLAAFSERGQRMVEQFNKAGFDGKLTLGENVADNVGLSFAYNAAFPEGKANPPEQQKFFIAYARSWCSVARPQFVDLLKKTDPHSMGYARINEQVKHQKAFSEAFSCKKGQAMNWPDSDRIRIW